MKIDHRHRAWLLTTLLLFLGATACYVVYAARPEGPSGGSLPGLLYGVAGSALMIYAGLLSVRKQFPRRRWGVARLWMRGHLYLGTLSVPFILFHAGFRVGGPLEQLCLWMLALVLASGVLGLALQALLPRWLKTAVPAETMYEQLPHVCRRLRESADELIVEACGTLFDEPPSRVRPSARAAAENELRAFYVQRIRPALSDRMPRDAVLRQPSQTAAAFARLRSVLGEELAEPLDRLEAICEERRQLHSQLRLYRGLHWWLLLHVPASGALLVFGTVHAVSALYY